MQKHLPQSLNGLEDTIKKISNSIERTKALHLLSEAMLLNIGFFYEKSRHKFKSQV